jgi:hypothetical protein
MPTRRRDACRKVSVRPNDQSYAHISHCCDTRLTVRNGVDKSRSSFSSSDIR